MFRPVPTLLAVLMVPLAWSTPAVAQSIRRCVDAQGNSLFTDRPCSEMNAVPKEAPPMSEGNLAPADSPGGFRGGFSRQGGFSPRSCARSPEDLLDRVRSALESRDVNRLASHYHWSGTGSGSGKRLMDALERIARQPLLSAELIYPEPEPLPDYREAMADGRPEPRYTPLAWDEAATTDDAPLAGDAAQPEPAPREPAAAPPRHMRILQMRSDQAEQATRTVFQLRRNAGCWWIQL